MLPFFLQLQLKSWDGVKLPLNGDYTEGINVVPVSSENENVTIFTVDGRRASASSRGLLIVKKNGKVTKVIR